MEFLVLSVLDWQISEPVPEDYLEYLISTMEFELGKNKTDTKKVRTDVGDDNRAKSYGKKAKIAAIKSYTKETNTEETNTEATNTEETNTKETNKEKPNPESNILEKTLKCRTRSDTKNSKMPIHNAPSSNTLSNSSARDIFSQNDKHYIGIDFQAIVNLASKNFKIWSQYPPSIIAMSAFLIVIQNRRFESVNLNCLKPNFNGKMNAGGKTTLSGKKNLVGQSISTEYFTVYYSLLELLGTPKLKTLFRPCYVAMNSLVQAFVEIEKLQVSVAEVKGACNRVGQSCSVSPVSTMSEK